jgi:hypothetical protein
MIDGNRPAAAGGMPRKRVSLGETAGLGYTPDTLMPMVLP